VAICNVVRVVRSTSNNVNHAVHSATSNIVRVVHVVYSAIIDRIHVVHSVSLIFKIENIIICTASGAPAAATSNTPESRHPRKS
jgi:hypothetical protein